MIIVRVVIIMLFKMKMIVSESTMFSALFILIIASASSKLVIDFARFLFDDDNHGFFLVKRKNSQILVFIKSSG